MDIHFVTPDLRQIDELKIEAICLPFFSDERPLRGPAGQIDWRLCGKLSRLIKKGILSGYYSEKLLIPARPRLPFEKVFLFGLGEKKDFISETNETILEHMLATLSHTQVRVSVLVLPGRVFELISPEEAIESFLKIAKKYIELDAITLIEDVESQKAMLPIVERERRRARASSTVIP